MRAKADFRDSGASDRLNSIDRPFLGRDSWRVINALGSISGVFTNEKDNQPVTHPNGAAVSWPWFRGFFWQQHGK